MNVPHPAFTDQDEKQERATLSLYEIASAEADLRGLTSGIADLLIGRSKEEEKLRAAGLARLEKELAKISVIQKSAYLQAVSRCPDLVDDERKIAFLEHEDYDAKLAAERLARYWEFKLKLFGPKKCFLPLTLHGAMKDEVPGLLKYCPFQVSARDTKGRAVIFVQPSRLDLSKYSTNNTLRALWYMIEAATEDPEVRRCGIVELFLMKNIRRKHFDPEFPLTEKALFRDVFLLQCRAIHICHLNPILYYVIHPVAKFLLDKELRLRIKTHYGSNEKVLSDLEGYCLPRDRVPSLLGGDFVLDLEKWVDDRLVLEAARSRDVGFQKQYPNAEADMEMKVPRRSACNEECSSVPLETDDGTLVSLPAFTDQDEKRVGWKAAFELPHQENTVFLHPTAFFDADNVSLSQCSNEQSQRIRQEKRLLEEKNDENTESKRRGRVGSASDKPSPFTTSKEDNVTDDDQVEGGQDAFYESIMELPGIEDPNVGSLSVLGHKRGDSFCERIMELPGIEDLDYGSLLARGCA